ncbi:hypothetical protein D3C75_1245560 [compost metagenome]
MTAKDGEYMAEHTGSSPASKAKRKYNDKTYERIPLDVKIGTKAIYRAAAAAVDKNLSLNAFIQMAVKEKMERMGFNPPYPEGDPPHEN